MKCTLTAFGLIAFLVSYAQAQLQPIELVNTFKEKGIPFEEHVLFSSSQQSDYGLSRHLDKYDVLELDEEALTQLLYEKPAQLSLSLPMAGRSQPLELELVQVDPLAAGFSAVLASTGQPARVTTGLHYWGVLRGEEGSVVAISFFENEMMGLLSAKRLGNLVLGPLESGRSSNQYILYDDRKVLQELGFDCATSDEGPEYRPEQLEMPIDYRGPGDCVRIYLEVDNDIFQNKGGASGTTNYITGLFNEVAALYANENISVTLSELYLWDTPSPYYGSNSYNLLTQFVNQRPDFNGDLGQLLSYQASGGIAYLAGLCNPYAPKHSFASIHSTYNTVPVYSWSAMVITHELGHLFGSKHTHACAWNGNNTAIDGCAGFVEGSCPMPGNPASGGTMMSYCHITSVGINFSNGFGPQPGNVIRNAVVNAPCLQGCDTGGGGGGGNPGGNGCEGQELSLSLHLDNYGVETTWVIRDTNDVVLYSGGPYLNVLGGVLVEQELCLEEGCYVFEILDSYGDGICCQFGQGYYSLKDTSGAVIASGGDFGGSDSTAFCLPYESNDSTTCLEIDFNDFEVVSFGGPQDAGYAQLMNGGTVLRIGNNAWKAIALKYEVTPNTMLELEFSSSRQGEIHGIGFDENNTISSNRTFRLYGNQNWGIGDFDNYPGGGVWKKYVIPVGEYYTGRFNHLFFVADHDRYPYNGNAYFRKVKIYEGTGCDNTSEASSPIALELLNEEETGALQLYPNPASDWLILDFQSVQEGLANIQLYSITGQLLVERSLGVLPGPNQERLDVSGLPAGAYLLRMAVGQEQFVERFSITRR
ncbi:MAG: T9SS type A sorting domain-containing protein [Lewinellaceae bacterium]|nr:T9SS type A sorting domain-containing protein [Lewinellaceae bacterium]